MSDTPITDRMRSRQMPDVVSFRARAGFRDDLRAAAHAAGVRPGSLIREAITDRIAQVAGERSSPFYCSRAE